MVVVLEERGGEGKGENKRREGNLLKKMEKKFRKNILKV